ncbi:MAG: hypothetical protein K9N49_05080 [Candidatus Marinimicrobia bacterium]|nr:hypothetical protein [Candidatus Neomarinimicrobiota bacterium]
MIAVKSRRAEQNEQTTARKFARKKGYDMPTERAPRTESPAPKTIPLSKEQRQRLWGFWEKHGSPTLRWYQQYIEADLACMRDNICKALEETEHRERVILRVHRGQLRKLEKALTGLSPEAILMLCKNYNLPGVPGQATTTSIKRFKADLRSLQTAAQRSLDQLSGRTPGQRGPGAIATVRVRFVHDAAVHFIQLGFSQLDASDDSVFATFLGELIDILGLSGRIGDINWWAYRKKTIEKAFGDGSARRAHVQKLLRSYS